MYGLRQPAKDKKSLGDNDLGVAGKLMSTSFCQVVVGPRWCWSGPTKVNALILVDLIDVNFYISISYRDKTVQRKPLPCVFHLISRPAQAEAHGQLHAGVAE